ncbi:MAG: UDP-glucose 4-epimerase GalE [Patescibacteria group bacterium]
MKILVTGGAGYIGSITAKRLLEKGHDVVVFDNLSQGYKENVTSKLVVGDLTNKENIEKGLGEENFDAVVHFAAYALAGESMQSPFLYFKNNILGGLNLLEYMKNKKIKNIVFSSTCAIYGTPIKLPVDESAKKSPESVYGESKLSFEKILKWYDIIYGLKHINLRYFNAAGAALDTKLGENHNPETHIIPLAIKAALNNSEFTIYGDDYKTEDGTCIRDYIHVEDLAEAHILALDYLDKEGTSESFNLGTGKGYSNRQVLEMVKKISGVDIKIKIGPRRPGDPPIIFADNNKAEKVFGFKCNHSDLETIVKTAWQWHKNNSKFRIQNSK